ncbi:MAG: MFS transporter [Gammaproteobacteria bacterium]|nr:MFS transporter [Gammaproteobacteria bacterium]
MAAAYRLIIVGALVLALGLGVRQTFGLFLYPISVDLGLTRESFGLAIAMQNLIWGIAQPFAGLVADRYGGTRVIVIGGLLFAGGLLLMAGAKVSGDLYISLGMLVGLGLSGTTFAVVLGAVGRAVPAEQRSVALGLVSAGGSLGMFVLVPGTQQLLGELGWVTTLQILAVCLLTVPVLAGLLAAPPGATSNAGPVAAPLSTQLRQARSHSGYWLLNFGFLVCGFHVTFVATHFPSYLTDHGITPGVSATALALIGFFNIVGTYGFGLLGGRYRKKYLLSSLYAARAAVMLMFLLVPLSNTSALAFAVAMGLLWLGTVPLTSGLVAQIFGVRYLSTLFGMVFLSHQLGSFLGAWLGGYMFDMTGSYATVWMISVILGVAAMLLHWPINDTPVDVAVQRPTLDAGV